MFVPLMFGDLKFGVDALAFNSLKKSAAKIVGRADLETLRGLAESGESRWLVSGNGEVFGKFAVESLSEDETVWLEEGTPLRVAFTLSLVEDLAEPGEENESSLSVLELNAQAREARAKSFAETWKKYENEKTAQTVESVYAETPTALCALCAQAYPGAAEGDALARVLSENAALADTPQPFDSGTEIFFPAEANTQSTLTTSLFESTFLSRLL